MSICRNEIKTIGQIISNMEIGEANTLMLVMQDLMFFDTVPDEYKKVIHQTFGCEFECEEETDKSHIIHNFAGDNAYYSCSACGIELFGADVGCIGAGETYANGEFAPCPECNSENSIDRDDTET